MSIVLTGVPSNNVRFGYENLLENGTVIASSEDADFPVENCFDWITNDFFKPAAAGVVNIDLTLSAADGANYFAFYGTDLAANGGTIKLQYHDGSNYVDATSTITVSGTAPYMAFFDTKVATLWRVVINSTPISSIASISFGEYMALERGLWMGFTEPLLSRNTETIGNVSDGGVFLGRSIISRGFSTRANIEFMSNSFARNEWEQFVRHAEKKPFYFAWNINDYPNEAAFCWTPNGDIKPPRRTHKRLMAVDLNIEGLIE